MYVQLKSWTSQPHYNTILFSIETNPVISETVIMKLQQNIAK